MRRLILAASRRLKADSYLVGGPVRDRLLQRPCRDWDIVTHHAKALASRVAAGLRAKLITLDEQYRIYRILHRDETLDFAEMQGKTIEEDLRRRDFTINAMASPISEDAVIDPFSGQKDLKGQVIRAVSRKAFQDDPLRLLRAYRFRAQFDFTIEKKTRQWIAAEQERLMNGSVAGERIREELLRLLAQKQAGPALAEMDQAGLLSCIFPEIEAGRRVAVKFYGKGGVVKHLLGSAENIQAILDALEEPRKRLAGLGQLAQPEVSKKVRDYLAGRVGGHPRPAFLKLAALLHDVGKPATAQVIGGRLRFFGHEDVGAEMVQKILRRLRFSRQETLLIQSWVRNHMRPGNLAAAPHITDKAAARFFRDLGEDGIGMLLVSLADHYTYLAPSLRGKGKDPVERLTDALLGRYCMQRETLLPPKIIDGNVLMKVLRLKPGPVIGHLLEAVQDAQAEGKVKTREDALNLAKKQIRCHPEERNDEGSRR